MSLKDALLITKLHLPSLPGHLLSRPRLIISLNEALNRKLTLITAPADYGKTTLLCQWVESLAKSDVAVVSV